MYDLSGHFRTTIINCFVPLISFNTQSTIECTFLAHNIRYAQVRDAHFSIKLLYQCPTGVTVDSPKIHYTQCTIFVEPWNNFGMIYSFSNIVWWMAMITNMCMGLRQTHTHTHMLERRKTNAKINIDLTWQRHKTISQLFVICVLIFHILFSRDGTLNLREFFQKNSNSDWISSRHCDKKKLDSFNSS